MDKEPSLQEMLEELISYANYTPEQKQQLYQNLNGAVMSLAYRKILNKLTGPERESLAAQQFSAPEELFQYLSKTVSELELKIILGESVEEVMAKFLNKIA